MSYPPRGRRTFLGVVAVLIAISLAFWFLRDRPDPVRERVIELLARIERPPDDNVRPSPMEELDQLGPKAYPALGELLQWHFSPAERFFLVNIRPRLPLFVLRFLPVPQPREEVRMEAAVAVDQLGPTAARALVCSLCRGLESAEARPFDPGERGVAASVMMRALLWSIPGSTQANSVISNFLSKRYLPISIYTPGEGPPMGVAADFWRSHPEWVPLLAKRLEEPAASDAANALALMGTNAEQAIPALVETAEAGITGPRGRWNLTNSAGLRLHLFAENRVAAIRALGKIGEATMSVVTSLEKSLSDSDDRIRFAAMVSLIQLKACPQGRMTSVVASLTLEQSMDLLSQIDLLGRLGPPAAEAVLWLGPFTSLSHVQALPLPASTSWTGPAPPEELRLRAIMAICRIAPDKARPWLPELASMIGRRGEVADLLSEMKSCNQQIIDLVQPMLDESRPAPALAAAVILAHDPTNGPALTILKRTSEEGWIQHRIEAAYWLWKRTGQPNPFVTLATQGLTGENAGGIMLNAERLGELGSLAGPAAPALKALLRHHDLQVRDVAGRALRQIAPQEMPSIIECN